MKRESNTTEITIFAGDKIRSGKNKGKYVLSGWLYPKIPMGWEPRKHCTCDHCKGEPGWGTESLLENRAILVQTIVTEKQANEIWRKQNNRQCFIEMKIKFKPYPKKLKGR